MKCKTYKIYMVKVFYEDLSRMPLRNYHVVYFFPPLFPTLRAFPWKEPSTKKKKEDPPTHRDTQQFEAWAKTRGQKSIYTMNGKEITRFSQCPGYKYSVRHTGRVRDGQITRGAYFLSCLSVFLPCWMTLRRFRAVPKGSNWDKKYKLRSRGFLF